MPFGNATFSDLGTAVSDIFARAGRRAESEGRCIRAAELSGSRCARDAERTVHGDVHGHQGEPSRPRATLLGVVTRAGAAEPQDRLAAPLKPEFEANGPLVGFEDNLR